MKTKEKNEKLFLIYNFFPLLYGDVANWEKHLKNISGMGFNIIYLNPVYQSGFSGSLYAPKDYFSIDKRFSSKDAAGKDFEPLKNFLSKAHERGLRVILDLVINHTSIDCPLIKEKPDWYVSSSGKIVHPGAFHGDKWMEWGDLARINNESSPDEKNLYDYWLSVCDFYLGLGFDGFRADAAYQVPSKLWSFLVKNTRKKYPGTLFIGETLGCEVDDTIEIAQSGFDAVMNSSKYWDYREKWLFGELYQQIAFLGGFPTVSFPESHDTKRLLEETDGNIPAFIARLNLTAFWGSGLMITSGFEFGFRKSVNVVRSTVHDYENTSLDFTGIIREILSLKKQYAVLREDSYIETVDTGEFKNVLGLLKISRDRTERVLFLLNRDMFGPEKIYFASIFDALKIHGKPIDISVSNRMSFIPEQFDYLLKPGEVRMIYISGKGGILKKCRK